MLPYFTYGCAHTYCWAWGFLCFLPVLRPPSGSWSTGYCGCSSPLGFPTFAMGSPLLGRGSFVLDRNEGLVSPFGSVPGWTSHICLRCFCAPWPSGCVAKWSSLCPCASVVLSSLQCSSLSHVGVQCCLPNPCLGSGVFFGTLPYFLLAGVGASVGGSALRPAAVGALFPGGPH